MSQDRIAKALALFQKFPGNDLSRFNLAQAYFDAGDYLHAAPHFRELCAKKTDWMAVHILLGKCLQQSGQTTEARQILERALQLAIDQNHDGPREELQQLLKSLNS